MIYSMVFNMALKQNLMERSIEIKFLIEKELRKLTVPCSVTDMVKRVGASRMPVEKHLRALLSTNQFDINMVRVGSVDVIYKIVPESDEQRQEREKNEVDEHESARNDKPSNPSEPDTSNTESVVG